MRVNYAIARTGNPRARTWREHGENWSSSCEVAVPPTGFEPVHPPPEGGALSPELRGRFREDYQ
jgi:hypothetical protein